MYKEELLKQLYDVLENGTDVEKVKITYKNGEVMKIAFDDDDDEGDDDDDEGDDDDEDDDDEDEEDDEDEDDEEEDDDNNNKDVAVEDKVENNDTIQEAGWKASR